MTHMDIELRCPACDRRMRVRQQYADRLVGCACGHITDGADPLASARSIIDEVGRKRRRVDGIMWSGGALVLLFVGVLAGGQGVDVPPQPLPSSPIDEVPGKTTAAPRSGTEWREPNAPTSPPEKNPASVTSPASRDDRSAHSEKKKAKTDIILEKASADADSNPNDKPSSAVTTAAATRVVTGHEWRSAAEGAGLGELRVRNGTSKDGVAVLVERLRHGGNQPRRAVYVRAGEEAHLHHVAVGGYVLQFLSGTDWNDPVRGFHHQAEGHVFAPSLKFTEADASDGGRSFAQYSVTLYKLVGRDARSTSVRPEMVRFDDLVRAD